MTASVWMVVMTRLQAHCCGGQLRLVACIMCVQCLFIRGQDIHAYTSDWTEDDKQDYVMTSRLGEKVWKEEYGEGAVNSNVAFLHRFHGKEYPMAKCLDGSPGSMYLSHGSDKGKFLIFHQGGGWCTGFVDCCFRATTNLGSSNFMAQTLHLDGGLGYLSRDPSINPYMSNYTIAILNYCDGASFSGSLDAAVSGNVCSGYGGNVPDELYFRGKYIREAAMSELAKIGILDANEVVIAGNSAGALATIIHADWYASQFSTKTRVTGLADSGVFLDFDTDARSNLGTRDLFVDGIGQYHNEQGNVEGRYSAQMQWVATMQNTTSSLDEDCVAYYAPMNLAWRCIFAQYQFHFLDTPIFLLQSIFDSWQLEYIAVSNGNETNIDTFGGLMVDVFEKQIQMPISQAGSFLESCYHHCGFWGTINIDGDDAATAHQKWLNKERFHWTQIAPFPCKECCGDLLPTM